MEAGTVIAGRYRLEREIGRGNMGAVWLARHETLHTLVALKIIHLEAARRDRAIARFEREGRLVARLTTKHVACVDDLGRHDGVPFIVMELLNGESLRERLDREPQLDPSVVLTVIQHAARALTHAHAAGLVHRDIKPANIFLADNDGELCVKLLDFGVCKVTDMLADDSVDPTRTGTLIGTPYYLSPEQAQGLKTVGPASDLWSLAVVAFESLSGRRPFTARSIGPLIAQIMHAELPRITSAAPELSLPVGLDAWIARAMAREPTARFASAQEMARAFEAALASPESQPLPIARPAHPPVGLADETLWLGDAPEGDATLMLDTMALDTQPPAAALPFISADKPSKRRQAPPAEDTPRVESAPRAEDTQPGARRNRMTLGVSIAVGVAIGVVLAVMLVAVARVQAPPPAGDGRTVE